MVDFAALPERPVPQVTQAEILNVKRQLQNGEIPPHLKILTKKHEKPSEITREVMHLGGRGISEAHKISRIAARTIS